MGVTLLGEGRGLRIGSLGSLLVMHFDGRGTLEALDVLDRLEAALVATTPHATDSMARVSLKSFVGASRVLYRLEMPFS